MQHTILIAVIGMVAWWSIYCDHRNRSLPIRAERRVIQDGECVAFYVTYKICGKWPSGHT